MTPHVAQIALRIAVLFVVGCASREPQLDRQYGTRRSGLGRGSIQGTSGLESLYQSAGHRVVGLRRIDPGIERLDTIVWFPRRDECPGEAAIAYLDAWLANGSGRTLVLVNRGYDLTLDYWRRLCHQDVEATASRAANAKQVAYCQRAWARTFADHMAARMSRPAKEPCKWFTVTRDRFYPAPVDELDGPWRPPLDSKPSDRHPSDELRKNRSLASLNRLEPGVEYESTLLLAGDGIPWVFRLHRPEWQGSKIVIVSHPHFTVNLGQTDPLLRELAARLVDESSPDVSGRIGFLETESADVLPNQQEAENVAWSFLFVWPVNLVMLHLLFIGLIGCWMVFPIFGRPQPLPDNRSMSFAEHVRALGDLLAKGNDGDDARRRVEQYRALSENNAHHGETLL